MHTATSPFPNSQTMPRDLRSGGPAEAGAGKTYPVDPEAVKRLKAHINGKATPPAEQPQTAVPSVKRTSQVEEPVVDLPDVSDPGAIYPPAAIAAARHEMAKNEPRGRRVTQVFTPEVVAVWLTWLDDDVPLTWIAEHNGLMPTTYETVNRYIEKHRSAAERIRRSKGVAAETAVSQPVQLAQAPIAPPAETAAVTAQAVPTLVDVGPEMTTLVDAAPQPDPEPTAEESAVEEPVEPDTAVAPFVPEKPENLPAFLDRDYASRRPGPGDALAALAALVNNEQLRVRGSVKLNLEIEFGE